MLERENIMRIVKRLERLEKEGGTSFQGNH